MKYIHVPCIMLAEISEVWICKNKVI